MFCCTYPRKLRAVSRLQRPKASGCVFIKVSSHTYSHPATFCYSHTADSLRVSTATAFPAPPPPRTCRSDASGLIFRPLELDALDQETRAEAFQILAMQFMDEGMEPAQAHERANGAIAELWGGAGLQHFGHAP